MIEPTPTEREALTLARTYVETASTRGYDGTNGANIRAEAKRVLGLIDAALAAPGAEPEKTGQGVQINLTSEEVVALRDILADDAEPAPVVLSVGNGHGGFGLYAWTEDYPGEGSVLIKALAASKTEKTDQGAGRCNDERDCTQAPWCRISGKCHKAVAASKEPQPAGMIEPDEIAANLVRLVGLDKHIARECEAVVRQLIYRASSEPGVNP